MRCCGFSECRRRRRLWVHGIVALAAAALTARAWALDLERKVPILAAATLLVPPYLFTYDALLLTLPMAWLLQQRERRASFAAVWLLSLLPVVSYVTPFVNTIPLAAIARFMGVASARAGRCARPTSCRRGRAHRSTGWRCRAGPRSVSA